MQAPLPVPTLLTQLANFPRTLVQTLAPGNVDWDRRPAPAEWSLTEVVCHLRDVEREVHQVRFRMLMAADNAFLAGKTADEWVQERRYQQQDGRAALDDFTAARRETVALLQDLDDAVWQRQGRHAFFGPTSMHELLSLVVRHDQSHWQQIQALLAQNDPQPPASSPAT